MVAEMLLLSSEVKYTSGLWKILSPKRLRAVRAQLSNSRGGVEDTRLEAKAKDTKKFRGQGQGQTLSRPRPRTKDSDASVLQTKKGLQRFFSGDLKKKVFKNFFQAKKVFKNFFSCDLYLRKPKKRSLQIFRKVSGIFQRNFNGSKIVLSSRRGQGNFRGLEASRPRPRTSKCVLEDVLEAKDVLEDSTSVKFLICFTKIDKWHCIYCIKSKKVYEHKFKTILQSNFC